MYHAIKENKMKTTKTYIALLTSMLAGKLENQNQQNYLFKLLNGSDQDMTTAFKDILNANEFEGLLLSDEQNQKGYDWLKNLWVTPNGKERKNNPFGYREQDALKNFSHCTLKGYYDAGNYYRSYYIPLYDVYTKDGYGFEYYVNAGQIHITG